MRETRPSGSEGGATELNQSFLPLSLDHDEHGTEGESLESILRLLGPTDDPHMLGRIGSYEVVGVIGRGGMGVVFKAFEPTLNRFVAIKMLLPHLAASGAARKRFAREGQAAAAVIDDNVMPIYSVAEWQGVPYLVTQYSRGATLQKRIQDQGPLELNAILRIGMQTARGLAAAHAQGLVHRDVKPSNILLDGTVERALLTDFGLARAVDDASITRTGIIAGTPQYMSPEQARGGSVDARSDLFGLGCVLYAMCTGRPPFRAENSYGLLRRITDSEPRPIREINPNIPDWLEAIIARLLTKSIESRWQTAAEVADLLQRCLAHVQQPAVVALPTECRSQRKRFLQRRFVVAGLVVLALAAAIPVGLSLISSKPMDSNGTTNSSASDSDLSWDATSIASQTLANDFTIHESRAEKLWDKPMQSIAPSHAVETDLANGSDTWRKSVLAPTRPTNRFSNSSRNCRQLVLRSSHYAQLTKPRAASRRCVISNAI